MFMFWKVPMAGWSQLKLATAQASRPSELHQTVITKHSDRLDEKRCIVKGGLVLDLQKIIFQHVGCLRN